MSDIVKRETNFVPDLLTRSARLKRPPQPRHLRDYCNVILKRKWLVLAALFTMIVVTAIDTFTATPEYRAVMRLKVDPESSNILPYEEIRNSGNNYWDGETYLQTQWAILQSRALAARVVKRLKLADHPSFNAPVQTGFFKDKTFGLFELVAGSKTKDDSGAGTPTQENAVLSRSNPMNDDAELVDQFLDALGVQPVRNTRLVEVNYTCSDPVLAADAVNAVAAEFIDLHFQDKYSATIRATEFLENQLQDFKVKVEKSEESLVQYAHAHNILNLADQENVVIQKLADLNEEMTKVESEMIAKSAEYERIKTVSVEDFPAGLVTEKISGLEANENELRQKLASLTRRYGHRWPDVQQAQEELAQVSDQLNREKEQALRQAIADYEVATVRQKRLADALARQSQLADQLNRDSIQYNILRREVETNKQLYEGLLQRLKEAGVSAGLKSSNINVIDQGEVPRRVFRPNKAANLFFGLIFGLVLSVGLAFFLDYLDNTLKTPEEVEKKLALPSLGVIPRFNVRDSKLFPKLLTAEGDGDGVLAESKPVSASDFRNQVWEAYRGLRTSILLSSSGEPPKVVMVTSALAGEGKTASALNTAIIFARSGIRTLIIDLDMRRPSMAGHFGVNGSKGMSHFLTGNSDLLSQIRQTSIPNLSLLAAGQTPPNPAELLNSKGMEAALLLARESFDHVIIDTPPVLSVTDALVISPKVDGVIIVTRAGKTACDAVRKATEHLEQVGARILGVVINDANLRNGHYRYYYKYYYDNKYYGAKS